MSSKESILIADDDRDIVTILKDKLEAEGYRIFVAYDGQKAVELAKKDVPDLILLDVMMPRLGGLEVKKRLNQDETTADVPLIFLTGQGDLENKVEALHLDPDDYITKPFESRELLARIRSVLNRRRRYDQMSMTDALTGLANVRVFKNKMRWLFNIARRYGRVFSVVVIDIDDLKKINDTWGHPAGDLVLRTFSGMLNRQTRASDLPIRYGGDEFVILAPESDEKQIQVMIDRLTGEVEKTKIPIPKEKTISFSISVGAAAYQTGLKNETELFEAADKNMYREKQRKNLRK